MYSDAFTHAELALASYADLFPGVPAISLLTDSGRGLSETHAQFFAGKYRVFAFYDPPGTDLQAIVFGDTAGNRYLAIRGTAGIPDLISDAISVAILGSPDTQAQYLFLKGKVRSWLADGTLTPSFTVTGHSLGGFLAGALSIDYPLNVSRAYLFNAPGVGGVGTSLTYGLKALMGLANQPNLDISRVLNFRADAGNSSIAGLASAWGSPIPIVIENQTDLALLPDSPGALNHSMQPLTDSMALYEIYLQLSVNSSFDTLGSVFKAISVNETTLESGLDALRTLVYGRGIAKTPKGERDAFYANVLELKAKIEQRALFGAYEIHAMPDSVSLISNARQSDPEALAYRYALKELNPFVLMGPSSVYASHNTNGELDLYDSSTGQGSLTDTWLADRASFLSWKNQKNIRDIGDDGFIQRTDFGAESFLFTDKNLKNSADQDYSVRVLGGNNIQRTDPIQILWGSDAADEWTGGHYADHLYGEDDDDLLSGGEGNDYLEGGKGNDRLSGDDGNDILIGGAGDDVLVAGEGSNRLEGGVGFDTYELLSEGLQTIVDADGAGKIKLDGVELTGGSRIGANRFSSAEGAIQFTIVGDLVEGAMLQISGGVTVQGFHNGDLGINLVGEDEATPRTAGSFVVTDDNRPDDINDRIENVHVYTPEVNDGIGVWIYDNIDAFAGIGNDIVTTTGNNNYLNGGADNDYLGAASWIDQSNVTLAGGSGTDIIYGGLGADRIYGEEDTDFYLALADGDSEEGSGTFGDWLIGNGGDDLIVGGAGNDVIFGGAGNNTILGGAGDDHLYGDETADSSLVFSTGGVLDIGLPYGFDFRWNFRQSNVLRNDRRQEVPTVGSDPITPAGWGNNTIYAGNGDDWVSGGYGDDFLDGGSGNDTLYGDEGSNVILGGGGNDFIASGTHRHESGGFLDGGEGDDYIVATEGVYRIEGGIGNDFIWADYGSLSMQGSVIYAGEGDDIVWGGLGDDYVEAGDGNDVILGQGGNDVIYGGTGDDYVEIREGAYEVFGNEGNDILSVFDGFSDSVLDGGAGDDEYTFMAGSGTVTVVDFDGDNRIAFLYGEAIDEVDLPSPLPVWFEWTGRERSIVYGDGAIHILLDVGDNLPSIVFRHVTDYVDGRWIGDDVVAPDSIELRQSGTDDADFIEAIEGIGNSLSGQAGSDYIFGASGNDTLAGGTDNDFLDGAGGNDIYLFNLGDSHDTLSDSGTSAADVNVLRFGVDIQSSDLSVFQTGDDLLLQIRGVDSGDSFTITGEARRDVIARVEFIDGTVWNAAALRGIAIPVANPEPGGFVDLPPDGGGSGSDAGSDGGTSPSPSAGGNDSASGAADPGDTVPDPAAVFGPPPIPPDRSLPPSVPSFFSNLASPDFAPDFETLQPDGATGGLASLLDVFSAGPAAGAADAFGAGPTLSLSTSFDVASPGVAAGDGTGRSFSTLPMTPSVFGSNAASSERADAPVDRSRDAGGAGTSSNASDASSAEDSPSSDGNAANDIQVARRDADPGGVLWLARQTDAPREAAPALTQWAIANALLQFRMDSVDESAAGNASASVMNFAMVGLPGASGLASLGIDASGMTGDAASLQPLSGLNEGFAALAA